MRVICFDSFDQLAPYADDWQRLVCGVPFRSWSWLSHWWRHYGPQTGGQARRAQLAILGVFDSANTLSAIVPWYVTRSPVYGRVLRPLGCGEVCSEYVSLLCRPAMEETIVEVVAEHLIADANWDLLDLPSMEASEAAMSGLVNCLAASGCVVHRRPGTTCWRLPLPVDWQRYVANLSKKLRRDVRGIERDLLDSGRAKLHSATRLDQLGDAMELLVDLHGRRRHMLGERGCFDSPRFLAFYRDVAPEMFRRGEVQFDWLEVDGRPVAAEYQLVGGGTLYAYQAGVDPDAMAHQPGKAIYVAILRRAIERGYQTFDFLRGDEPYKARFGAMPVPIVNYRVVARRPAAQFRHNVWLDGKGVKRLMKKAAGRVE